MTINAVRAALRVEYQVVYGYGIVGSHLGGREQNYAAERLAAHQLLRDAVMALEAGDADRPTAQPAYRPPFPVTDASSARALAIRLEDAAAGAAWDVIATEHAGSQARKLAVPALGDIASAAAYWRARARVIDDPALPGAPPGTGQVSSQPSTTSTTSPNPVTTASGSTS